MDFVELIQKYQERTTSGQMKAITVIIGKFVATHATEEELHCLYRDIYGVVSEGHFDRHFADEAIKKMWYEDDNGDKSYCKVLRRIIRLSKYYIIILILFVIIYKKLNNQS